MFIVHVMPYTKGKVSFSEDVARNETFRVSDGFISSFLDNVISKKVYVSVRPAFSDDENVHCWKLIE